MKKLILFFISILSIIYSNAQSVEMADAFRNDGKIYVVIAVVGLMLTAIVFYLIKIDNKLSSLEK